MNFENWFKELHPAISTPSAHAVLKLVEDGGTVPFIARYRKEQTGNLDEVAIQAVIDGKERWDSILKRQQFIVEEIDRQKKLTPELKAKLMSTFNLTELDDLYLPYKVKRKTKAQLAREAGLEPLAEWIWNCGHGTEQPLPGQTLELWAFTFRNEEKGFADAAAAMSGAQDILIERLSETQELRQKVREQYFKEGFVRTGKGPKVKPNSKYENYFNHAEPVESLLKPESSHRYLAMRRGWMEEELSLNIGGPSLPDSAGDQAGQADPEFESRLLKAFEEASSTVSDSPGAEVLAKAARLALKVHVMPSIDGEVHKALKEVADEISIKVFAENVKTLLLSAPLGSKAVLGVDPGIRTGCKIAVVDESGKYIASTVMYLQTDGQKTQAKEMLGEVTKNGKISAIAVGNGTAGRETEVFIRGALKEQNLVIPVVMVSESGASVYSASEVAREEFPDLDLTVRGAISIARRLQDPLAELVKVDPKSIGVGQYQHDVSQPALKRSLELVVDSCVNQVGVDVNTASYHLLSHVAGIGPSLAKGIVEYRGSKGLFKSRQELMEIPRFSKKTFEQAAGFLRIQGAENPLDTTGIHPERYPILEGLAQKLSKSVKDLLGSGVALVKQNARELKEQVGEFTFNDIVQELEKPGRDPREEFVPFQYREDIHELKDLKKDMICPGIVTNVTNFGAFVDIGVHQDGLVHVSQLSTKFIKDPREAVNPGDRVNVKVLEVNLEKNQISLSIKAASEASRPQRDHRERHQPQQPHQPRPAAGPIPTPIVAGGPRPQPVSPKLRPSGKPGQGPRPHQAFNNAFAGLAGMKSQLKPK
ncbi:Tex family protein [Bdellovibrionota bacterium FG-1]